MGRFASVAVVTAALFCSGARAAPAIVPVDLSAVQPLPMGEWDDLSVPAVASDGVGYLVVWTDAADAVVKGVRVDGSGAVIDATPIAISGAGVSSSPAVVHDGAAYVVVWATELGISGARIDSNGAPAGAAMTVATCPDGTCRFGDPEIASNGSVQLVTWWETTRWPYAGDPPTTRIQAARLTAGETLDVPALTLSERSAACYHDCAAPNLNVGSDGVGFLVVFNVGTTSGFSLGVNVLVDGRGSFRTADGFSNSQHWYPPAVTFAGGGYHVLHLLWAPTTPEVWDAHLDAAGQVLEHRALFKVGWDSPDYGPFAAFSGTHVLAVWKVAQGLVARRFLPELEPFDPAEFTIGPHTAAGAAAASNGASFLVAWAGAGALIADDTEPPALYLPAPFAAAATDVQGASVSYSASALDAVGGEVPVTCTPASGSLFPPGRTLVTCTATDAAGNVSSGAFAVEVVFEWSGVLPPVDAEGGSVFKLGRTVPVKLALTGASAGITTLAPTLLPTLVSERVSGTDDVPFAASGADSGNTFRYDAEAGQYVLNLATGTLSAGTWRLGIALGDGVEHAVFVSLRP